MLPVVLFWFRRDLRLQDNAGLYHALRSGYPVLPIFIFDKNILDGLTKKEDKRVQFIYQAIAALQQQLLPLGSSLKVMYGNPADCLGELMATLPVAAVYTNHDYEPYASKRDTAIAEQLRKKGILLHTYKDQVIFEKDEVMKDNGTPYTVFTPYSRKWKEKCNPFYLKSYPTESYFQNFHKINELPLPGLQEIGFNAAPFDIPTDQLNESVAASYDKTRDFPAIKGTTRLGLHLRFGTISVRTLARDARQLNETFLNELIWREFYMMILWHFPYVVNGSFKKEYDNIVWRNNEAEFALWCAGNTGFPIVDAGMRELNATGYMHNRVRMITASFLTKNLLIDWRWGEAWFAEKLLDFDLAANNGGWQWAAGCGCDAAPYFRVFNPTLQTEKFDPKLEYVRQWAPEFDQLSYPRPMVDLKLSRERCLKAYQQALK